MDFSAVLRRSEALTRQAAETAQEEISLAEAIQRAEPSLSRSEALREAARIVRARQTRPY